MLADGYGDDTGRKITLAGLKDEAAKCANISDVQYAEAGGERSHLHRISGNTMGALTVGPREMRNPEPGSGCTQSFNERSWGWVVSSHSAANPRGACLHRQIG